MKRSGSGTRIWLSLALFAPLLATAPAASAAPVPVTGTLDLAAAADVTFARGAPGAGGAVAAVGDVNGDGITDFAVGYRNATRLGRTRAGVVAVVFGRSGGVGPTFRLGELAGDGFEIVGAGKRNRLGAVIAGGGDVNGDGLDDVLIGRPTGSRAGRTPREGVVYVVFGRKGSRRVDLANLGAAGFRIFGAPGDRAGAALAAVGDLDGDGRPEIAVGAPGASPGGRAGAGRVMIVLSSRRTGNVDLATVGAGALEIDGAAAGDRAGTAVAGLPDVNGDGRPDVAIGAPGAAQGAGLVAVVDTPPPGADPINLGSLPRKQVLVGPGGTPAPPPAPTPPPVTTPPSPGPTPTPAPKPCRRPSPPAWGRDGRPPGHTPPKPCRRRTSTATTHTSRLPGHAAATQRRTLAVPAGAAAGSALASVGDLDRDGVADLAVGAPLASPQGRERAGAVYLVSGSGDGSGSLDTSGPWLVGAHRSDRLGSALDAGAPPGAAVVPPARAVAVGAPITKLKNPTNGPLGRPQAGAAYVVFPDAALGPIDLALPPPGAVERLVGTENAHAGAAVALANDSGETSVLVGASRPSRRAAAWLVIGVGAPGLPDSRGARCARNTNLEVMVDDSDSLKRTDPQTLRRHALDLLLTKPDNKERITGALEFGTDARQIFPPLPAPGTSNGALHDMLVGLMSEHIRHDGGMTDFNAAFRAARAQNPQATARIVISDGYVDEPGVPTFDLALAQGPPTYVIGLGRITAGGTDDQHLAAIAASTGGEYFRRVTAGQIAPLLDTIDAVALCGLTALPTAASRRGARPRQGGARRRTPTVGNGVRGALPASTKVTRRRPVARFTTQLIGAPSVVDLTLTWEKKADRFVTSALTIVPANRRSPIRVPAARVGRALAGHRAKYRGLTLRGSRGASYATLRIAGLRRATAGTGGARAASGRDKLLVAATNRRRPRRARRSATSAARAAGARVSLAAYRRR